MPIGRKTRRFRSEPLILNEAIRKNLPGSFIKLINGTVHYELSGPEMGNPVVFIPGITVPYSTWDRTVPFLAKEGFRCLRFDFFGRGYSDRPRASYDLGFFVDQVASLLDALGMTGPVDLVALSMGGAVAASLADRWPDRIRRIAFVDPLFSTPTVSRTKRLLISRAFGRAVLGRMGKQILAMAQRRDFRDIETAATYFETYRPQLAYRGFRRAILTTMRSVRSWKITEAYERIGQSPRPIALFWGVYDRTIPYESHGTLLGLLPRAEFHPVEDSGHVPHYERPEIVNPLLAEFLSRPDS
jgi:pimeloyl-ACP methyl ester carboxylesterase